MFHRFQIRCILSIIALTSWSCAGSWNNPDVTDEQSVLDAAADYGSDDSGDDGDTGDDGDKGGDRGDDNVG